MSTPEGMIKNSILSWLKAHRIVCFIHDSMGVFDPIKKVYRVRHSVHRSVGVPDIIGILPGGRFLAIEVKSRTGTLSEHQKQWIELINRSGGLAFMARSITDVIDQFNRAGVVQPSMEKMI